MANTGSAPPTEAKPELSWHALPVADVLAHLGTDRQRGLSVPEATDRLERFGPNCLPPIKRRSAWMRLLLQFHNLLIYVLLVAALTTALLGDFVDTAVIVAVVLLNALIGFIQEGKAEAALEAVRKLLSPSATVMRDGRRMTVPAEDVVPGDLVLLQSGDKVPADLRLIETRTLNIDESVLTGESVPVEKSTDPVESNAATGDRFCLAFSGTLVTYGQGIGIVVATGRNTEIGRISELLAQVDTLVTPLLRKIEQFARWLTAIILGGAAATFLFGWVTERLGLDELFMAAVSLAVAAIPEGLPAIVTITLAVGVQRMAQRKAILRKLPAVETLGSVTVICSDKTGTLTRNEMTAQTVAMAEHEYEISGVGYQPSGGFRVDGAEVFAADCPDLKELARAALLCNDAALHDDNGVWRLEGDPTEGALVVLALKAGLDAEFERRSLPRVDAIPFESEHRFMATLHRDHAGHGLMLLKGAPEVVLERCDGQRIAGRDVAMDRSLWHQRTEEIAARGQRLLALAMKPVPSPGQTLTFADTDGGFSLLGVVGMIDPPRPEAIDAVARCRRAGIKVKMITGDHSITARAVGAQLGIGDGALALTGAEIEALGDAELRSAAARIDVVARANPEHKLRLVNALRAEGDVVAMTGDGVNDAPALKAADIGVAMGQRGTEAAKEAAEMVLADDNFATIAAAVREGRTVYDNLRKTILFAIPANGGQGGVIIAAILLGAELPVTPLQILWINLVIAVTLALTLAFEAPEGDLMDRPPRHPTEPLVTGYMLWRIIYVSLLLVATTLALYEWELNRGEVVETARTAAVNTLVAAQLVYLINSRFFLGSSLSLRAWVGNRYAVLAMSTLIGVQLVFTYAPFMQTAFGSRPLEGGAWLRIAGAALAVFLVVEFEKGIVRGWERGRGMAAAETVPRTPAISASVLLAYAWSLLMAIQWGITATHLFALLKNGAASVMGSGLAVLTLTLAAVLLFQAVRSLRAGRAAGVSIDLIAPALLLAAAHHAPGYPFSEEHLPWLIVVATALTALSVVHLVLSRLSSR